MPHPPEKKKNPPHFLVYRRRCQEWARALAEAADTCGRLRRAGVDPAGDPVYRARLERVAALERDVMKAHEVCQGRGMDPELLFKEMRGRGLSSPT